MSDGRPVAIRLFDSLISAAGGGPSWTEVIGLDPVDLLVIETDGSWEQPDSLKTAYDGAAATGLNVFAHPVDEVARQPGFAVRAGGLATLSADCRACPVVRICGGGLYAHRYRASNGFDNPSVYCADLKALIGEVTANLPVRAGHRAPRPRHELPADALDALSAGPGDAAAIALLSAARLSLTRALVASVAASTDGWMRPRAADGGRRGLGAPVRAGRREARRGAGDHVPLRTRRRGRSAACGPRRMRDRDLDRAHLAALAAAAAMRAGTTVRLPLPVRDGTVHLPTVGTLRMGAGQARTAMVSVSPERVAAGHEDGTLADGAPDDRAAPPGGPR